MEKNTTLSRSSLGTGKSTGECSFTVHQESVLRRGRDLFAAGHSLCWLWDSRAVHVGEQAPNRLCLELGKLTSAVPESPFTGKQVLKDCGSL